MDRTERRDEANRHLHKGFGDSLALAFELAVTPAIFAMLGWIADRRLGTSPVLLVSFFAVAFAYLVWKQFRRYDTDMRAHQDKLFGGRDGSP